MEECNRALAGLERNADAPGLVLENAVAHYRTMCAGLYERVRAALETLTRNASKDDHETLDRLAELGYRASDTYIKALGRIPPPVKMADPSVPRIERPMIRLPEISIEKFHGDPMRWLEFRDQFTIAVHNQPMEDHQKLAYLRAFAPIPIVTGAYTGDYNQLWDQLCERFNDDWQLVQAWFTKFEEVPRARDTREDLEALVDKTRIMLRAFSSIGLDIRKDPLLAAWFHKKLPAEARLAFGTTRSGTTIPTMDDLITFTESRRKNLPEAPQLPHSSSTRGPAPGHSAKPLCVCPENHPRLVHCPRFREMSIPERRQATHNRCQVCFHPNHHTNECRGARSCYKCQGRHHTLLCTAPGNMGEPREQAQNMPQNVPRH